MQQFDESKAKAPAVYYPNNIGIATPGNPSTYTLLIDGKSEKGTELVLIVEELLRRGVKIIAQNGWIYDGLGEFTLSITCDLKDSRETPDDLVIKLRAMKFVSNAKVVSLKRRMFSGLLFPLTMMDTTRVVALNSEAFFKIQDHLKTHAQKSDLIDAGRDCGKDVVKQIREKFGITDSSSQISNLDETIKDNIIGFMSAAGWGKLRWDSEKNVQRVLIQDPPTAASGGSAVGNYFLQGLVAGLTEGLLNRRFTLMEDRYDSQTRLLNMSLMEQSQVTPIAQGIQIQELTSLDKAVVLKEVQKIVQSVENPASVQDSDKNNKLRKIETVAPGETKSGDVLVTVPAITGSSQVQITSDDKKGVDTHGEVGKPGFTPQDHQIPETATKAEPEQKVESPPSQERSQQSAPRKKTRRKSETYPSDTQKKEETAAGSEKEVVVKTDGMIREDAATSRKPPDDKDAVSDLASNEDTVGRKIVRNAKFEKERLDDVVAKQVEVREETTNAKTQNENTPEVAVLSIPKKTVVSKRKDFMDQPSDEFRIDPDEDLYYNESFE